MADPVCVNNQQIETGYMSDNRRFTGTDTAQDSKDWWPDGISGI